MRFKSVEEALKGEAETFEEIPLDQYCFPLSFAFLTNRKPVIDRQLVINDEKSYQKLLLIRRSEQKCLTMNLPPINFEKKTMLAQYTSGSCAISGFNKRVFKDGHRHVVNYVVEPIRRRFPCSGMPGESLNLIVVPKVPANYKVDFLYKTF